MPKRNIIININMMISTKNCWLYVLHG